MNAPNRHDKDISYSVFHQMICIWLNLHVFGNHSIQNAKHSSWHVPKFEIKQGS